MLSISREGYAIFLTLIGVLPPNPHVEVKVEPGTDEEPAEALQKKTMSLKVNLPAAHAIAAAAAAWEPVSIILNLSSASLLHDTPVKCVADGMDAPGWR